MTKRQCTPPSTFWEERKTDGAGTDDTVYGIAGTAAIPFVYYAVDLARGSTLHPSSPAREGLPALMAATWIVAAVALLLVFAYLLVRRLEVARLEAQALAREPAP